VIVFASPLPVGQSPGAQRPRCVSAVATRCWVRPTVVAYCHVPARGATSSGVGMQRIRGRTSAFAAYTSGSLLVAAAANAPVALFEPYRVALGLGHDILGILYAAYTFSVTLLLPFVGRLSDRFGRRLVACAGLLLIAVGSLLLSYPADLALLVGGRVVQGFGVACVSASAAAALSELDRSRGPFAATVTLGVGGGIGPGIVAMLSSGGSPGFGAMIVVAVLSVVSAAWIVAAMDPGSVRPASPGSGSRFRVTAPFVAASCCVVAAFGAQVLVSSVLGSWLAAHSAGTVTQAAGFSLAVLAVTLTVGVLVSSRLGPAFSAGLGASMAPAFFASFLLSVSSGVPGLALSCLGVAGFMQGLAYAGSMRLVAGSSPEGERGLYVSIFLAVLYVGSSVPALVAGLASGAAGFSTAVLAAAGALCLLGLVVGAVVTRFRPSSVRSGDVSAPAA
jgi:MFS family permease